ncbi:4-hydroxybenzoate polyprenyltransferase, mitochondrial [Grifola frondosa]|uniref:4-hydroxybenzoate polyprenyltransferase, mitochondrial n=1 Tax=Grifola frondosa TaxID=5627 RepID=A0A1C7MJ39_GRIFR|nr:4-hydroxybenzoate polyprenyltransferase, mitochondrial [Grifola frondosa]
MLPAGKSAFIVGCIGLFGVDMIYPFTKRWTNWPQFILGIAMTWGLPVAWISNTGSIDWNMIPVLFLGGMCWTIYYDTIYACQDRRDDVKAGVKSTAVLFGDAVRPILACFATAFVFCLAYAGMLNGNGMAYFVITVAGAAVHFAWQLTSVNFDIGADCWRIFKSNGDLGYIMFAGMICDYALRIAH